MAGFPTKPPANMVKRTLDATVNYHIAKGWDRAEKQRRVVPQGAKGDTWVQGRLEGGSVRRLGKLFVADRVSTDSPVDTPRHKRTLEFQPITFQDCDSSTNRPEPAPWMHIDVSVCLTHKGKIDQISRDVSLSRAVGGVVDTADLERRAAFVGDEYECDPSPIPFSGSSKSLKLFGAMGEIKRQG
jgi:hypothetical protein